jgi:hypothetical protein
MGRSGRALSTDSDIAPTGITSDIIHLSEVTPVDSLRAAVNNPIALCTDPEVLHFAEAAMAKNTVRAYDRDIAHFLTWGGSIPANPGIVAKYLAAHSNMLSVATLAHPLKSGGVEVGRRFF